MQGRHLYQAVDKQGYRHAPLRVAFGRGEKKGLFENRCHVVDGESRTGLNGLCKDTKSS
jgi:hypothetical protein